MDPLEYIPRDCFTSSTFAFAWGLLQKGLASNSEIPPSPYVQWIRPTIGRMIIAACLKCFLIGPIFLTVFGELTKLPSMMIEILCISFAATIPLSTTDVIFFIAIEQMFRFSVTAITFAFFNHLQELVETYNDLANRLSSYFEIRERMDNMRPGRPLTRNHDNLTPYNIASSVRKTRSGTAFGHYPSLANTINRSSATTDIRNMIGPVSPPIGDRRISSNHGRKSARDLSRLVNLSRRASYTNQQRLSMTNCERTGGSPQPQASFRRIPRTTRSGNFYGYYPFDPEALIS